MNRQMVAEHAKAMPMYRYPRESGDVVAKYQFRNGIKPQPALGFTNGDHR